MSSYNQGVVIAQRKLPYRIFISQIQQMEFSVHRAVEIIYIISGDAQLLIGEETYVAEAGEFFFVNSNQAHWVYEYKEPHILLVLQVEASYLAEVFDIELSVSFSNQIRNQQMDNRLCKSLQDLYLYSVKEQEKRHVGRFSQVVEAMRPYIEHTPVYKVRDHSSTHQIILQIAKEVNTGCSSEMPLREQANRYNISVSHLCRMFKKITGTTYNSYIRKTRVNQAVDLLINTQQSITEIALECGFATLKSMNEAFNIELGISAKALRQQQKKIPLSNIPISTCATPIEYLTSLENLEKLFEKLNTPCKEEYKSIKNYFYQIDCRVPALVAEKKYQEAIDFHILENKNEIGNWEKNSGLDEILQKFSFKELRLCFSYRIQKFFLQSGFSSYPIEVSTIENLLNKLQKKGIKLILHLDIELDIESKEALEESCKTLTVRAIRFLSAVVGRQVMSEWKFEFGFPALHQEAADKEQLIIYTSCLITIIKTLRTELKGCNWRWGVALGNLPRENEELIFEFLESLRKKTYFPDFYHIQMVSTFQDIQSLREDDPLNQVENYLEKINGRQRFSKKTPALLYISVKYHLRERGSLPTLYRCVGYNNFILEKILQAHKKTYHLLSLEVEEEKELFVQEQKEDLHVGVFYNRLGLPASSYYLYNFLDQLHNEIIFDRPGCLATKSQEDLHILLYPFTSLETSEVEKEASTGHPLRLREYSLYIKGMRGFYKIIRRELDHKSGSSYHAWKEMGKVMYVNAEEKQYLRSQSIPRMKVSTKEIEDYLEYHLSQHALGITLIKFQKL